MDFLKRCRNYDSLDHAEAVRFKGIRGRVWKPAWGGKLQIDPMFIPVVLEGSANVHHLHIDDLETQAAPQPKPEPVKQYRETNVYVNPVTGALYQETGSHLVCINSALPSLPVTDKFRLRRMYREP